MSIWLNILIDIGILSLIGLMYYYYQKKRIIRVSHENILSDLESYRFKVNEYVDARKNEENYQRLKEFSDHFEKIYTDQNLEGFNELLNKQDLLSNKLKEQLNALNAQIVDHLASK